jgi:phosphoribosylformylglycinamidine synthase
MVLRAAGINCNEETCYAFELAGARATQVHVNRLLEQPALLGDFGLLAVPGGFSYGDDIAAGRVLGVELRHALGEVLRHFVDRRGLILGICNGFQVLVNSGLLPGATPDRRPIRATLHGNDSDRYEDRWVHLAVDGERCLFAPPNGRILEFPVAHAEGRFTVADPSEIEALIAANQAVFRYVEADGSPPRYPSNPNGSMGDIAGICDASGQVLGLMPHPERALFPWNHPCWTREEPRGEGDGLALFRAAVTAMRRD